MPFDPTKPVDDSLATAGELRGQLNALKGLTDDLAAQANNFQVQLDGLPSNDGMIDWLTDRSARNVDGIQPLTLTLSGPLTQAQGQALLDKLNQLIAGLHH
jgi:hypothetical protein